MAGFCSCSTKYAVGPELTFDMRGCYATSLKLEKKLEEVGFGAGNKMLTTRSETVGSQGGGRSGGVGSGLIAQCCLCKEFQGHTQCRVATGWKLALPYHASGAGLQPST